MADSKQKIATSTISKYLAPPRRSCTIALKLTPDEYAFLQRCAKRKRTKLASFTRASAMLGANIWANEQGIE